ncbi:MAG: PhzF family phenazine biosynthesis protein [Bacillota bacterium]
MRTFPILQVDAFTEAAFCGNPAAIVLDAQGLSNEQMQAIAQEMNLSETAFVLPSDVADFRLRFFTPRKEIPMAGHPTIATVHALIEDGRISLTAAHTRVTLQLNVGVLPVEIRTVPDGAPFIVLTQQRPEFLRTYPREPVAAALNLAPAHIIEPIQTVNTGTPQLMVRLHDAATLEEMHPDFDRLVELTERSDFFSVHVFALIDHTRQPRAVARHFAPAAGVNEDPVTGSASGAMGAYLVHYGLVDSSTLVAEQGHAVGRPGRVHVEVVTSHGVIEAVKIGGQAITIFRGQLLLY